MGINDTSNKTRDRRTQCTKKLWLKVKDKKSYENFKVAKIS